MTALSLADLKKYLRYEDTSQDDPLTLIVSAAQRYVENYTGHIMVQREVTESFKAFPMVRPNETIAWQELRWRPYVADSLEITYLDEDKTEQEFTDFYGFTVDGGYRVAPNDEWPDALTGITFTYSAGYETPPDDLIHAVAVYCAMSDEDRANPTAGAWNALHAILSAYRCPVLR